MSSKQDINIRTARPEDCEAISRLVQEFAIHHKVTYATKMNVETFRKYGFGADKLFSCFVAVDNKDGGAIVGYALYYFVFCSFTGKNLFMHDLYLQEPYRQRGIGGQLWREVARVAVQEGCERLEWLIAGWNQEAWNVYMSKGTIDVTKEEDYRYVWLTGKKLIEFAESAGKLE